MAMLKDDAIKQKPSKYPMLSQKYHYVKKNYLKFFPLSPNFRLSIKYIMSIHKAYKNFLKICWNVIIHNYPMEINSKNGKKLQVWNLYDLVFFTNKKCTNFMLDGDVLNILNKDRIITKFENWRRNGDFIAIYSDNVYGKLDCDGKTVFDIGANIGDSPIFFSINGASKVIAVEPAPLNFQALEKNIKLNSLDNIQAINCGIGGHESTVTIKKDFFSNGGLLFEEHGDKIKIITLDHLIKKYPNKPAVLKMDCEGYEYGIVLNSTNLDFFDQIIMEYHINKIPELEQMKAKLESDGFSVEVKEKGLAPAGKKIVGIY